jgi:hypothetical protein
MCCCRVNLKFGFGPQIVEICVPQITAENSRKERSLFLGRPMCVRSRRRVTGVRRRSYHYLSEIQDLWIEVEA